MIVYNDAFETAAAAAGLPLTLSRIGYKNYTDAVDDSSVTASGVTSTGPKDAPLREDTYEYWEADTLPAYWTLDLGQSRSIDYVGIAAHTLYTEGSTVKVRASTDGVFDAYVSLPGVAGNDVSTPDSATVSITGDIDVRIKVSLDDWSPGSQQTLIGKYDGTDDNRSWGLAMGSGGAIEFYWSPDGTIGTLITATMETTGLFVDGGIVTLRVTLDVDDGGGNWDVNFYTSDDDGATWDLQSAATAGTTTSIYDGTADLIVGGITGGGHFAGKIYWAEVYSGIAGTLAARYDAEIPNSGDTSWVSTTGETWTINTSGATTASLVTFKLGSTHTPTDNSPILVLDSARSARYIRIDITGASGVPRIGVVYWGAALVMPTEIGDGFSPINLSAETELDLQFSQTGQFLAQQVRSNGFSSQVRYKFLDPAWVRSTFLPFIEAARQYPYFFAWAPSAQAEDVGYCWNPRDIHPSYMGTRDYMTADWTLIGHA